MDSEKKNYAKLLNRDVSWEPQMDAECRRLSQERLKKTFPDVDVMIKLEKSCEHLSRLDLKRNCNEGTEVPPLKKARKSIKKK